VGSLITTPLRGLVVNILSRFSWHGGTHESNHFWEQRMKIVMTVAPTSTSKKTTKVNRLKEDGFCVFLLFFCLSFVLWWVLFLTFSSKLERF
jgi:hypothetical protein